MEWILEFRNVFQTSSQGGIPQEMFVNVKEGQLIDMKNSNVINIM